MNAAALVGIVAYVGLSCAVATAAVIKRPAVTKRPAPADLGPVSTVAEWFVIAAGWVPLVLVCGTLKLVTTGDI